MYGNPDDETTRKDSAAFLEAFTDKIREQVEERCRSRYSHNTRSEEEFNEIVEGVLASELRYCGEKLARLLTQGID